MAHKGDKTCQYSTIKACEQAKREVIGKCSAMTDKEEECPHWGIDRVDNKAYCGQHLGSVYLKADAARRAEATKAELDGRITAHLAWRAEHPSVWDSKRDQA